ncbi:MAG: LysM peptidoglycan-binding domain-containing protein [Candidatus Acidiferrales bacterium]
MTKTFKIAGLAALLCVLWAAGCADTARNAVSVRPPTIVAAAPIVDPLPLNSRRAPRALATMAPNGDELVARAVNALFEAGQQDYRAGHLDKARQEFDQSLEVLLSSGYDLKQEPRLQQLFDHILETVHADEMVAFRDGDGFSEQQTEPSPLDEMPDLAGAPPAPADPALRGNAEGELASVEHDLPLTVNDYVLAYLNFFQTPRGRAIVATGLRRAGRYREMISNVLREEGLPQDLIYLAQNESAFQPQALSREGARGLWQFMSSSGRLYGLQKNWWVDDRQDPEKATRAAAADLRGLYNEFGDWYLAMAAYDCGPMNVERAIQRTGYADFWELYRRNVLPKETRNYVPIIIALALISKDPARYGIDVDPEPAIEPDSVKPGHAIDLRLVAETIDVDLDTLRTLNPQLLRLVTPEDPNFVLHLPEGTAERFYAEIAAIPADKWVSWRNHRVEEGETLSSIAKEYRVSEAAIAAANGIDADAPLEAGGKLIIPVEARADAGLGRHLSYRVRRDDTLASIADEFDVSTTELRRWNHLRSDRVTRGMRLSVYPGGMAPPPSAASKPATAAAVSASMAHAGAAGASAADYGAAGGQPIVYRVKPGETLWSIARGFRTTVEALRDANRYLFSRPLEAGDELTILRAQ